MKERLEFRAAARSEFDDAADWYFHEDPFLRDRFVNSVDSTISFILSSPNSFPVVSGTNVRRALVRGFPYLVFYQFDDPIVTVLSVFHTSRNPIIWKGRID
jgi:plasmid stabilization system protein ParE